MHIGEVIKKAWDVTWRYKILWLFGFFAAEALGGGGAGGNFSGGGSGGTGSTSGLGQGLVEFVRLYWPVIVAILVFFTILGIVFWILSIAARGGIVSLASDADAGKEVRGADGWSAGFHFWGRILLQQILFALPLVLLGLVIGVVFFIILGGSIGAIIAGVQNGGRNIAAIIGGAFGLFAGVCGFILIVLVLGLAIGLLYLIWVPLAIRYAVLMDRPAAKAMGDGWRLIRSRFREVALAGVTLWAISLAFGIVLGLIGLTVLAPSIGFLLAGIWPIPVLLFLVFIVIAGFAGAVFSAFYSSAWTIAFRRITGLGPEPALAGWTGAPPVPSGPVYTASTLPEPPQTRTAQPAGETVITPASEPAAPDGDLGPGYASTIATQPAGPVEGLDEPEAGEEPPVNG